MSSLGRKQTFEGWTAYFNLYVRFVPEVDVQSLRKPWVVSNIYFHLHKDRPFYLMRAT